MVYLNTRLKNAWFLLASFQFKEVVRKISFRIFSDTYSIGLQLDLTIKFDIPEAQIPLTIRPLRQNDIPKIFDFKNPSLFEHDKLNLVVRLEHIHANIPTCYVAVTNDDTPVFIEWLMGHTENKRIQAFFNEIFPLLSPDEMLLENAFTLPEFRGKGIMASAVARIAELGKTSGARRVITFIEQTNIASLKASKRAGFHPYVVRHEKWFLFHRTLTFTEFSQDESSLFGTFEAEATSIKK
jgi:GNAT superfamily N-acetyltransferase